MRNYEWQSVGVVPPQDFVCGYCGNKVATDRGYYAFTKNIPEWRRQHPCVYICPNCDMPTFFSHNNEQVPSPAFGHPVEHLPSAEVERLYDEARNCMSVNAYTASILCCRKLLMNIAVAQGALAGGNFVGYVNYLESNNYIPPGARAWVDHIRLKGNEATHEIAIMGRDDAEELLTFSEMLLKFMYEFPGKMSAKHTPPVPGP